jgi:hypothetical protein
MQLSKDRCAIVVGGRMPELELCKVGSNLLHKGFFCQFFEFNDISETFHMAGTRDL